MPVSFQNPLNVPIRIDATYSNATVDEDSGFQVVPPLSDFSQLGGSVPTTSGGTGTVPWLGDIVQTDIQDTYALPQGIHLHWTLPKSLRSGVTIYSLNYPEYNELIQQGVPWSLVQQLKNQFGLGQEYTLVQFNNLFLQLLNASAPTTYPEINSASLTYPDIISDDPSINVNSYVKPCNWNSIFFEMYGHIILKTAVKMKMPPVPNRWLVIRYNETNSTYDNSWIVESDRLSYSALGPTQTINNPVVVNTFSDADAQNQQSISSIFQYLGLNFDTSNWSETEAQRLTPLTSIGNGTPEFANSYVNCYGVFGFCDSSVTDESSSYTYSIIGWYSNSANDPMSSSFNQFPWANKQDMLSEFHWNLTSGNVNSIDGSIYTATIQVSGSNCIVNENVPTMSNVNVSIGNTSSEALSAFLVNEQSVSSQGSLGLSCETLLNAVQTGQAQKLSEPDGTAVIENALHQEAFEAKSHNWLWEVHPLPKDQIPHDPFPLPDSLASDLSVLNQAQAEFDKTQSYLLNERNNLFSDWCRAFYIETSSDANIINLQTNSEIILNQSSDSINTAGMGNSQYYKDLHFLSYQAGSNLYAALTIVHSKLAGTSYYLKKIPAPRFYGALDPHILMSDSDGSSSPLVATPDDLKYNTNGYLNCTLGSSVTNINIPTTLSFNTSWDGPNLNLVFNYIQNATPTAQTAISWRPLYLQWQTNFFQCTEDVGDLTINYKSNFLSDNFLSLNANNNEYLSTQETKFTKKSNDYVGKVILNAKSLGTLQKQILQLCGLPLGTTTLNSNDLPSLLSSNSTASNLIINSFNSSCNTLAQKLDGFNERFLMQRKISQISVFDPNGPQGLNNSNNGTWDTCNQTNYVQIGKQYAISPDMENAYNPIRAGKCELHIINLVDAFGQKTSWSLSDTNFLISNTFQDLTDHTVEDPAPTFFLPPRLAQSSRLQFRWLTAFNSIESNNLVQSSPICGWVVLNRINQNILFFNPDGSFYGTLNSNGDFEQVASPNNLYINNIIAQVDSNAQKFFDDIDNILLTIEPHSHRQSSARTVLMSSPLAISQVMIKCELLGSPAPHQGFEWLKTLNPNQKTSLVPTDTFSPVSATKSPFIKRASCGFTDVEFPVFLGDPSMSNDGLVLYWNISNPGASVTFQGNYTRVTDQDWQPGQPNNSINKVTCNPSDAGTNLLVLHDPRAPLHITSIIHPTKSIVIPPTFYKSAFESMEFQMTVGPIITDKDQKDHLILPVPVENTGKWTMLTEEQDHKLTQADDKTHFKTIPPTIHTGTMKFKMNGGN